MHVRRQLTRLFSSLRRKEKNKENSSEESSDHVEGGGDEGRRRERKLKFHNLSLRLKLKQKENSLSQSQLLNIDDEDGVERSQVNEAVIDEDEPFQYLSCKIQCPLNYLQDGGEDIRMTQSPLNQELRKTSQSDMKMDLRHALSLQNENDHEQPQLTLANASLFCSEGNTPQKSESRVKKKRVNFKKSAKTVKKAFQDGFIAWGHSMTYAATVMPSLYECQQTTSMACPYFDCKECKSLRGFNYSLQCSHPNHHTQLPY